MTAWIILVVAIVLEVAGTIAAKQAMGFKNLIASGMMVLCYGLSLTGLTLAMKNIEMSIAYPLWTGISIVTVSVFGIILFNESMSSTKGLSIFFLTIGVVGLAMGHHSRG